MKNSWALILLAALAASCQPLAPQSSATPAAVATRPAAEDLRLENSQLAAQLAELRSRDEKLSAEVQDLRFLTRQQKIQIQELAQAPLLRDKFKAEANSLRQEVRVLRVKFGMGGDANTPATVETPSVSTSDVSPEVLARFLPTSRPASQPASAPASSPDSPDSLRIDVPPEKLPTFAPASRPALQPTPMPAPRPTTAPSIPSTSEPASPASLSAEE